MTWLERLRAIEKARAVPNAEPTKLTEAPSVGFGSAVSRGAESFSGALASSVAQRPNIGTAGVAPRDRTGAMPCTGSDAVSEIAGEGSPREIPCIRDLDEERAAIVEFEAGIPREWAEGFAQLDPEDPPAAVPLARWQAIVDGIGAFLDRWGVAAAKLGWTAEDLFGADPHCLESTWFNCGALWAGSEGRVVEVHADRLVFQTPDRTRQTYLRHPPFRPRVLPWEISE
jgi:hypothetical protein